MPLGEFQFYRKTIGFNFLPVITLQYKYLYIVNERFLFNFNIDKYSQRTYYYYSTHTKLENKNQTNKTLRKTILIFRKNMLKSLFLTFCYAFSYLRYPLRTFSPYLFCPITAIEFLLGKCILIINQNSND